MRLACFSHSLRHTDRPPPLFRAPPPKCPATFPTSRRRIVSTLAPDATNADAIDNAAARLSARKRNPLQASASAASFTQQRRQDALERQRTARWDRTRHARLLALQQPSRLAGSSDLPRQQVFHTKAISEHQRACKPLRRQCKLSTPVTNHLITVDGVYCLQDEQMQEEAGAMPASASTREYWAGQLMQPEWLIDIPEDLATDWCACQRT